jgi:pimeloyl-ACP methyl ester carboxylesterase
MQAVYLFSGLGADKSVMDALDLPGFDCIFIEWLSPLPKESLQQYVQRLAAYITKPDPIFVGLSFGGVVAQELARIVPVRKVVILASVKSRKELPFYYRWAGRLQLHRLVPAVFLKTYTPLAAWLFGAASAKDRQVFAAVLRNTDSRFLRWAIGQLLQWHSSIPLPQLLHIHGDRDHILPLRYIKADQVIPGGGHLMTLSHTKLVSAALLVQLRDA